MNLKAIITLILTMIMFPLISNQISIITWMLMEMMTFLFLSTCSMEKKSINAIPSILPLQFMASSMMLMSIMIQPDMMSLSETLMTMAIMMKMGMYPFSYWMIKAFKEMSWNQCIMMMTIMKLPALVIMPMMMSKMTLTMMIINIVSPMILTTMTIPLIPTKEILAISSGIQSSWMINCMMTNSQVWMLYFTTYITMTLIIMMTIKMYWPSETILVNPEESNNYKKIMYMTSVMTLMGVPPSILFMMKSKALLSMSTQIMMPTISLIISSSFSLIMYSRIFITYMFSNNSMMKKMPPSPKINLLASMWIPILISIMITI